MEPFLTNPVSLFLIVALYLPPGSAPAKVAIQGKVMSEDGYPLPGVVVVASNAKNGFQETEVTNWNGFYQVRVTPGSYRVVFELSGLSPEQHFVYVSPGNPIALDVTLRLAAVREAITVTAVARSGTAPVKTIPANPADDPLRRLFMWAASLGVLGPSPLVPTLPEMTIDGGTVPPSVAAGVGSTAEGIGILSAGIPAEYGGGTGGLVVFIPEAQATDLLTGEVRGQFQPQPWRSDEKPLSPPVGIQRLRSDRELAGQAGAALIPERLWVFARLRRATWEAENESSAGNVTGAAQAQDDVGYLTLTARPFARAEIRNRLFSSTGEARGLIGDYARRWHGDDAALTNERGVREWWNTLSGSYTIGPFSVSASGEAGRRRDEFAPLIEDSLPQHRDVDAALFESRSPGFLLDTLRLRSTGISTRANYWWGTHDISAGVAAAGKDLDLDARLAGGRIFDDSATATAPSLVRFITTGETMVAERIETISRRDENLYLQDAFRIGDRLSLNIGGRWERLEATGPVLTAAPSAVLPRVAGAVDLFGNGKSRVLASYSAYHEELADEELLGLLSGYGIVTASGGGAGEVFGPAAIVDPDLRPRTSHEVSATYSQTFLRYGYLSATVSRRDLRTDIARASCGGVICIGNPSRGLQETIDRADGTGPEPAPGPERSRRTIQIEGGWRHYADALGLTYTNVRTEGNIGPRLFPQGSLPVDPFLDARRAFAEFNAAGAIGPLHSDRQHHVVVNGTHGFGELRLYYSGYWMSGAPLSRYGYSDHFGDYLYVLGPRGSGRTPSAGELNVAVDYHYPLTRAELFIQLIASNLLDSQTPLLLDERWSFREADNDSPTPVNPHFGQPLLRIPPRQLGIGLRIEF